MTAAGDIHGCTHRATDLDSPILPCTYYDTLLVVFTVSEASTCIADVLTGFSSSNPRPSRLVELCSIFGVDPQWRRPCQLSRRVPVFGQQPQRLPPCYATSPVWFQLVPDLPHLVRELLFHIRSEAKPMMRIQTVEGNDQLVLQVEGRLDGDFVTELEQCWQTARANQPNREVSVDLTSRPSRPAPAPAEAL